MDSSVQCSLVLVVSPLVALMADQVHSLRRKGVKGAILSGSGGGGLTQSYWLLKSTLVNAVSFMVLQRL